MTIENISQAKVAGGWHKQYTHFSATLDCNMRFAIFLPPNASKDNPVPVFNVNKRFVNNNKDKIINLDFMNQLGYDVGNFGNHEFNYGLEFLDESINDANFPYINANVFDKNTGELVIGPVTVPKQAGDLPLLIFTQ